jgi:long-chain acyl-CoA synthetase
MAEAFPDEIGYKVVDQGSLTFRQWNEQANAVGRGLIDRGIKPNDRVAVHLHPENAKRWLVAYAAVHRAGGVAVPMNPRLAAAEVGHMLAHSGARAVFADGELVDQDLAVAGGDAFMVDATPEIDGPMAISRVHSWDDMVAHDGSALQIPRTDEDLADILYTSGTTGRPKGVAVRHMNASMVPQMDPMWTGGGWVHASPMFTFAGLAFVYTPMRLGLQAIYQPRFDAGRWFDIVEESHPVAVFLVPSMAHLLLDHPRFESADLSSITMCSIGSAPLAPFVVERLQNRMPDAVVSNNYGMTEAGSAYCVMPKGEAVKRPGSVGQIAPPAKVRVVQEVDGIEVPSPPDEVGEVRLQLPGRQREYFGDPEATANTWVDGWLITGDLGKLDQDGYLYIVGRSKDVIIRGGNNVHAADVEHVLISHPAVAEVAVVGAPHAVLGEDVAAFVVLSPGKKIGDAELRTFALEQLADYKVPRQWIFVSELPRNATGKVTKPELRARLQAAADKSGLSDEKPVA